MTALHSTFLKFFNTFSVVFCTVAFKKKACEVDLNFWSTYSNHFISSVPCSLVYCISFKVHSNFLIPITSMQVCELSCEAVEAVGGVVFISQIGVFAGLEFLIQWNHP